MPTVRRWPPSLDTVIHTVGARLAPPLLAPLARSITGVVPTLALIRLRVVWGPRGRAVVGGTRGALAPTPRVTYAGADSSAATTDVDTRATVASGRFAASFMVMVGRVTRWLYLLPLRMAAVPSLEKVWRPRWTLSRRCPCVRLRRRLPWCRGTLVGASAGSKQWAQRAARLPTLFSSPPAPSPRRLWAGKSTRTIRCTATAGAHRDPPLRLCRVAPPLIVMGTCSFWGAPPRTAALPARLLLAARGTSRGSAGAVGLLIPLACPTPPE
jgi:hypothetical protein